MVNNQTCQYSNCDRDIWPDSVNKKCIFHEESDQKAKEFLEAFKKRVEEIEATPELTYSFIGYYFPDEIDINEIIGLNLDRYVDFSLAKFCGNANFVNITFQQGANFTKTEFRGSAKFELARFHYHANFTETEFRGSANFDWVKFHNGARFTGAKFYNRATYVGKDIFPEGADFSESQFSGIRAAFNTDVSKLSFIDAILHNVDFTESTWQNRKGRILCKDEADAKEPDDYKNAKAVCCNIKQCYQKAGVYDKAGEFYYGEMECNRKQKDPSRVKRLTLFLLRYSCGYGERPVHALINAIIIIFLFALIFSFAGIVINDVEQRFIFPPQFDWSQLQDTLLHLWHCLYFSIVTFTTLGYGDYHPSNVSQPIAALESLLGILITALFIFTFGRKMIR